MAAYNRSPNDSIEDALYHDGDRFEFFQAVRLLEQMRPNSALLGTGVDAAQEPVRFFAPVSLAPAATAVERISHGPLLFAIDQVHAILDDTRLVEQLTEAFCQLTDGRGFVDQQWRRHAFEQQAIHIQTLRPNAAWRAVDQLYQHRYWIEREGDDRLLVYDDQQAAMHVNVLGLAGVRGPLPLSVTQLILDRNRDGDTVLGDFLDIFNHRLIALLYRAHKMHRVGFEPTEPGKDQFASFLFAVLGLRTDGLHGRMVIQDRSLLRYAGLLSSAARSASGLEQLLCDFFELPVHTQSFQGRWMALERDQWTAIGVTEQKKQLGASFLLGQERYDMQTKLTVALGPLSLRQFKDFLPQLGSALGKLVDLVRFYLRDALDFDIRLQIKSPEVPEWRLGSADGHLGWLTWLPTTKETHLFNVIIDPLPAELKSS